MLHSKKEVSVIDFHVALGNCSLALDTKFSSTGRDVMTCRVLTAPAAIKVIVRFADAVVQLISLSWRTGHVGRAKT